VLEVLEVLLLELVLLAPESLVELVLPVEPVELLDAAGTLEDEPERESVR
jgi:hypothetical protein